MLPAKVVAKFAESSINNLNKAVEPGREIVKEAYPVKVYEPEPVPREIKKALPPTVPEEEE